MENLITTKTRTTFAIAAFGVPFPGLKTNEKWKPTMIT